jgi:hypothetical protein
MQNTPKHPAHEEDKYRKQKGREAAQQENDSQFLNEEGLEDDLVNDSEIEEDNSPGIINEEHPENQEWNVREDANRH